MNITRGDYKKIKFQRKNMNNEIITDKPDKMYFTIKNNEYTKDVLIQKTFENGITFTEEYYYVIEILPKDTDNLSYGKYYFDIEIIINGKPKTIKIDEFNITKEITFTTNEV